MLKILAALLNYLPGGESCKWQKLADFPDMDMHRHGHIHDMNMDMDTDMELDTEMNVTLSSSINKFVLPSL
jgi:hypothetical protein